jgi:hypothetical protein
MSKNIITLSAGRTVDSLRELKPGQQFRFSVTTYGHRTLDTGPGIFPKKIEGCVLLPIKDEGRVIELPFTGGRWSIGKVVATYPSGHVFTAVLRDGSIEIEFDAGDGNTYSWSEADFFIEVDMKSI